MIFDILVFDNFTSPEDWFAETLEIFATFSIFNKSLCGKSVSLVSVLLLVIGSISDDNLKVTHFYTFDFNLSRCKFDDLVFLLLYSVIYSI